MPFGSPDGICHFICPTKSHQMPTFVEAPLVVNLRLVPDGRILTMEGATFPKES